MSAYGNARRPRAITHTVHHCRRSPRDSNTPQSKHTVTIGSEHNLPAVRRPGETGRVTSVRCQATRAATAHGDEIDVVGKKAGALDIGEHTSIGGLDRSAEERWRRDDGFPLTVCD